MTTIFAEFNFAFWIPIVVALLASLYWWNRWQE